MATTTERTPARPPAVRAATLLFYLIALIWVALAVATVARMMGVIVAVMMLGNAVVLAGISWGVSRQKRIAFWLGLGVLALNIVLSVTDQFGFLDIATMLIDIALFVLLIITRRHYSA